LAGEEEICPTAQVTTTSTWQLGSGGERKVVKGENNGFAVHLKKNVIRVGISVDFLESISIYI